MATSEIEKLERRYAENPQGLTFAPLAEVHRKNGDIARALDLLRTGLELHPDYIPASIVLGRCHLDLGDLPAAETAFTHVLSLDGENVIALKALADINERHFRFDDAEHWLNTLLSVDRSNDEARDQLERVLASRRQAEQASSADPDASLVTEAAGESAVAFETTPSEPSETLSVTAPPPPQPPAEPWGMDQAVPLDLEELVSPPAPSEHEPEGLELEQPVTIDEAVTPLEGLVGRDQNAEPGDDDRVTALEPDAFRVELSEEIVLQSAGGGEFQVPNAAEELARQSAPVQAETPVVETSKVDLPYAGLSEAAPTEASTEAAPTDAAAPQAEAAQPAASVTAAAAGTSAPDTPAAADADHGLVLTESMAELLAQQGHVTEALQVFRALEVRLGSDPQILRRIGELETAQSPPPARQAFTAKETHGQSVAEFFRALLAARPPAMTVSPAPKVDPAATGPSAEAEGAPTRPAHDSLSLSSIFGDEGTPTPPAVPVSAAGSPSAPADATVSFDEFYNPPDGGDVSRRARGSDTKSDDLDQFHTWLQNLKR
jgi:tetratricopeptide (TPR) repeat protein